MEVKLCRDTANAASRAIEHGEMFPYEADDTWWNGRGESPPPAKDWAHAAARGVLADLQDRRGVKHALSEVDEETRVEIVESLAAIIRQSREGA